MRSRIVVLLMVSSLALSAAAQVTSGRSNSSTTPTQPPPRYMLIDLGTFGGPESFVSIPETSYAQVLNNRGVVTGWASTNESDLFPDFCFDGDCFQAHAFLWDKGALSDLGTLSEGVSSQGNWVSDNGLIAGVSQNGQIDPLVPGFTEFRATLWRNGQIIDLGTLDGGYESIATAVNNRGQVVGFATNTVPDSNGMFGTGFQTRAFLWQNDHMTDLGTLGAGTDAMALLINEREQIAGNSYINSEANEVCAEEGLGSAVTHAFLWDHGTMIDLGNLGGSCTFVSDLNNHGQVVGGSRLAEDHGSHPYLYTDGQMIDLGTFGGTLGNAIALNERSEAAGWAAYPGDAVLHAAVWKQGKIQDIGVIGGDASSFGFSINLRGQIVGVSVPSSGDFDSGHGFFWQPGTMMASLESLVAGGSSLRLTEPETINDKGEIAGIGFDSDGNQHAFLMIPCDDNANQTNCASTVATPLAAAFAPYISSPVTTTKSTQPAAFKARFGAGARRALATTLKKISR